MDNSLLYPNEPIVMVGPNVVVKGDPYMPYIDRENICNDVLKGECKSTETCISSYTFNLANIDHLKTIGWNDIRLEVMWAGAQRRDEDVLDPYFLEMLHAVLDLKYNDDVHVILDNHGDLVGIDGCGNGVPMWFQRKLHLS
jgi:hypothetical protein